MVKRTYNLSEDEPNIKKFDMPSEKEHLFQVTDIFTFDTEIGEKLGLDKDIVSVRCEVVGGGEEGRTLLQRINLDEANKGFFATRLFLKAIGESYKGASLEIDTDRWIGRQFYATVIHNSNKKDESKKYANIDIYNFDKQVEQFKKPEVKKQTTESKEIAWDE